MKVLHVVPSFYPAVFAGGPTQSVYGLCNALVRTGRVELRVLTTDTSGPRLADRLKLGKSPVRYEEGYDVHFCRKWLSPDVAPTLFAKAWSLVRWADVVHLTAIYSSPTVPTLLACRGLKRPLVWSPRGTLQRWQGSRRRIEKQVWEMLCNLVVDPSRSAMHFTSEEERRGSLGKLRVPRSFLIPNGVDLPDLRQARRRSGALRVLFMGRIDVIKGLENLIQAVARLPAGHLTLKLCGTGDANYIASLQRLVTARGLDGQVQFAGQVTGAKREESFSEADLLVLPSHQESFGMVVVEALGRGLPVIASKGTPWAELENVDCGWWVDAEPASLADALMAASRCDLVAMGARGHQWVLENFSWDRVAAQQLREYERMINSPSPA